MGHIDASPETGRKWPEPEVTEVIRGVLLCPSRSSLCSPILSGANLRQAGILIRNCGSATAYSAFRGNAGVASRITGDYLTPLKPASVWQSSCVEARWMPVGVDGTCCVIRGNLQQLMLGTSTFLTNHRWAMTILVIRCYEAGEASALRFYFRNKSPIACFITAPPTSAMERVRGISFGQASTQFCA